MDYNYEDEEIFDEKVRQFMIREGWDKLSKKELEVKVSEALELLMKLGQVMTVNFITGQLEGKTKQWK